MENNEKVIINKHSNKNSKRIAVLECVDCDKNFSIPIGKLLDMHEKGLILPCRCEECKKIKDEKFDSYLKEGNNDV